MAQAPTTARDEMAGIRKGVVGQEFVGLDDHTRIDKKGAAFAAADIIASTLAMIPAAAVGKPGLADAGAQTLYRIGKDAKLRSRDVDVKPNPWFVANGHADAKPAEDSSLGKSEAKAAKQTANQAVGSPLSQSYLKTRDYKTIASSAIGIGGSVASTHTAGVNVASSARHLNAGGSTLVHWLRIRAIAEATPKQSGTIIEWCNVIMRAKAAKGGSRVVSLASSAIPKPFAGPIATIIGAAAGLGIKVGLAEACYLAAIEIHWRAFQEQTMAAVVGPRVAAPVNFSRPFGAGNMPGASRPAPGKAPSATPGAGPASRIFAEVLKRRGATRVFGAYDVAGLIREPAGWMVLGEKLAST